MAQPKTQPEADVTSTTTGLATVDEKSLYLDGMGASDADADAKAIVARIMQADNAEDVFGGPGQLLASEDLVGVPFTLVDIVYRESDLEDGPGVYSLLHIARWGTSQVEMATCGARNVMAAGFRGKQLGLLPRGPVTLVEGKRTRKGYIPLWLQDMDKALADKQASVVEASEATGDKF